MQKYLRCNLLSNGAAQFGQLVNLRVGIQMFVVFFFYLFCIFEHFHNTKLGKVNEAQTLVSREALTPDSSFETG